jgi:hypothetical protein
MLRKFPPKRAESSLTENVTFPFQAEPTHLNGNLGFTSQKFPLTQVSRDVCNCWWSPFRMDEGNTVPGEQALSESSSVTEKVLLHDL